MEQVIFAVAFFAAYTIQAITGFAGNVFSMPVATMFFGLDAAVAILNTTSFLACGLLAVLNYRHIVWKELGKIAGIMLPFVILGIWLDSVIPLPALLKIFGVVVILVGIRNLLTKEQRFMPEWLMILIIMLAGLIQGMFVSGGALLVIYAIQKFQDKLKFRATLSALWAIFNLFYALIALYRGYFTVEVVSLIIICIPLAMLATFLGARLIKHISQQKFLIFVYWLLIAIGVLLIFSQV
ncbi:MAG: sulfite exporter TauE/SafE family protein [Eggerthellaceae bacterium]|jgi:uncharacterized membrane protein YfcA